MDYLLKIFLWNNNQEDYIVLSEKGVQLLRTF